MLNYLKRRILGLTVMRGIRRSRALAKVRPVNMTEGFTLTTFDWVFTPTWEASERREMARMMQNCDLFVDIGANHGFYSVMADYLGKPSLAIEPEPTNLDILRLNTPGKRIEVIACAVGDESGTMPLFGDHDTASPRAEWHNEGFFRQTVPVETLDNLLGARYPEGRLLIKIDVEGAEDAVLAGAKDTLRRPSEWMIETMPVMPSGEPSLAYYRVFEIMSGAGFQARLINGSKTNWLFER